LDLFQTHYHIFFANKYANAETDLAVFKLSIFSDKAARFVSHKRKQNNIALFSLFISALFSYYFTRTDNLQKYRQLQRNRAMLSMRKLTRNLS